MITKYSKYKERYSNIQIISVYLNEFGIIIFINFYDNILEIIDKDLIQLQTTNKAQFPNKYTANTKEYIFDKIYLIKTVLLDGYNLSINEFLNHIDYSIEEKEELMLKAL
jgi:hypothetical protein